MAETSKGKEPCNEGSMKGDGSFRATQEMASETSAGQDEGQGMPMTSTDSRPTAPGNSPGIGNKGNINN